MPSTTAALLVGGLGTRLRGVLEDRPKVMAEVGGRPFLSHLLDQVSSWKIREAVLCTGYLGDQVKAYFGDTYKAVSLRYSREWSPLGTAGALRLALPLLNSDLILVMNGDSYCRVDFSQFWEWHCSRHSKATMLLVNNPDTGRYGSVRIASDGLVTKFVEKGDFTGFGLINAGIYIIKRSLFEPIPDLVPISLEREVFPTWLGDRFYGFRSPGPFLDIGTPESYAAAKSFFTMAGPP